MQRRFAEQSSGCRSDAMRPLVSAALVSFMLTLPNAHAQSVYDIPGMGGGPGRAGLPYYNANPDIPSRIEGAPRRDYGIYNNRGSRTGTISERPYGAVIYDNRGRRIETIVPRRR
jgi:hypothetical protein